MRICRAGQGLPPNIRLLALTVHACLPRHLEATTLQQQQQQGKAHAGWHQHAKRRMLQRQAREQRQHPNRTLRTRAATLHRTCSWQALCNQSACDQSTTLIFL